MTQLLTTCSYNRTGVTGNCGGAMVSRIKGAYITPEQSKTAYKALLKDDPRPIKYNRYYTIAQLLQAIQKAEPKSIARGRAYPLEWAFAAILDDIAHVGPVILGMTDTEDGRGDGHKGICATRHFAEWLQTERFVKDASLTTGYRGIKGEGGREVYGWWFAPDYGTISPYLKDLKDKIIQQIKEWNNVPEIKEKEKALEKARSAISEAVEASWDEWRSTNPDAGDTGEELGGGEEEVPQPEPATRPATTSAARTRARIDADLWRRYARVDLSDLEARVLGTARRADGDTVERMFGDNDNDE
jgi:hypothetical protein